MKCARAFLSPAGTAGFIFGHRGACAIPHPKKANRGGEDAFFSHRLGLGVADGVGGFAEQGVNPAIYTRNVMRFTLDAVKKAADNNDNDTTGRSVTALDALTHGWVEAKRTGYPGACPATLVTIVDGGAFASILNLGDCGTLLLRGGKLLYQSTAQQHRFNCPYQLPVDPPGRGEQAKLELREGDVVLCASDGVLDNVDLDDLIAALARVGADSCEAVAAAIGAQASANGANQRFMSPFAKHAMESGYQYVGGKVDDVTALVARVSPGSEPEVAGLPELITDVLPNAR